MPFRLQPDCLEISPILPIRQNIAGMHDILYIGLIMAKKMYYLLASDNNENLSQKNRINNISQIAFINLTSTASGDRHL